MNNPYKISKHILLGDGSAVKYVTAGDHGGTLIKPTAIVLHYTAGGSASGAQTALTNTDDSSYVSAHLIVDTGGTPIQLLDFRTIAYHAGVSSLNGRSCCNSFTIGIELVNPGYRRPGFTYLTWPTISAAHKNGGPKREWFQYAAEQVTATAQICAAIMNTYETITQVVGHDDIAPARKLDPGPAFDWTLFRAVLDSYR